ncbi:amine oxidase (plasmid) [Pseudonocardia sp. EC080610-09]|nr:amine oxidase [Pseudonocardia sp. EC080610-09]
MVVLGAGISGLVAAYELERRGFTAEVLEAAPHVGGRIHTHRFGTGDGVPFVELGAMRIPANHRHTLSYVEQLGLSERLSIFRTLFSEDGAYHTTSAGFVRVRDAAAELVADFRKGLGGERYPEHTVLFGAWLTAIGNAIAPAAFRSSLHNDVSMKLLELVDGVDLNPFLGGERADRFDLHAFFAAHPALRTTADGRLNRFLDDILNETSPELLRLDGGMDQLTETLRRRLSGPVRCGHEVVGLSVEGEDVVVHIRRDDEVVARRYGQVLCTIPFSVLRGLQLEGLNPDKRAVIDEVTYWSATKVAFLCREPFWENDGISGGASFSGGRVRQTYYPPVEGAPGRGAVLLASYTMGEDADVLGELDETQRHQVVLEEVGAMHPELHDPGMVREIVSRAWGQDRLSLGGGVTRWGKDTAACARERDRAAAPDGRLYFAGEHCSSTTAWVDGAIESALGAVERIDADNLAHSRGARVRSAS